VRARWLAIGVAAVLLYFVYTALAVAIPFAPIAWVLAAYALLNAATAQRLHGAWPRFWSRRRPVTERELAAQLVVDIAALTFALYFTGGGINPFAASYLLLVVYASVALPPRPAWTIAVLCTLSYASLHFFNVPLPLADSARIDRNLNYFAHFNIYVALAALLAGYGLRLSDLRRLHLARAQAEADKDARERYLVGLAALSAGTAHQMSTPLSTMAVVVGDLRESGDTPPADWKQSIDMLWGQIQICKRSLEALAQGADVQRMGKVQRIRATQFARDVAERFRALRPEVQLKLRCAPLDDALMLSSDPTLPQAVLNFLGNAADASPHSVEMRAGLTDELRLAIQVLDRGPGIPDALRERIGRGLVTTKESGHGSGAGVLIGCAAVERFGGTIRISDRQAGGTIVQIELPLFQAYIGGGDEYRELRIA
jgi:two-component system sensor histidine kinase RegB